VKGGTVVFSRGSGSGGRHAAEQPRRSGRHATDRRVDGWDDWDDRDEDGPALAAPAFEDDSDFGPYDIEDAPPGLERVDLGSLQIPSVEGVEVRVQANAEGIIQQVVLGYGESALQLGVFAAPRSERIWDEVRTEIRKSLFDDGVAVEEVRGDYGPELRARVRTAEGLMDIRFIGIDGPRWMVRAVYQGRAAADPRAAGPLARCLRGLVVNRGRDAMPVREALPLRLPKEVAEQARAQAAAAASQATSAPPATNGQIPSGYPVATAPAANGASGYRAAPPGEPAVPAPRRRPSPRPRRSE
jgi:hypothetical protein